MPSANAEFEDFVSRAKACRICAARFAETATMHAPRPVVWLSPHAPILIAGQAPGIRVHESGIPFDDRSGDRLRDWLGVTRDMFYDRENFAILPMAFCFPGYNAKGHDLAPPKVCAKTWRDEALSVMSARKLTILIGGYAQKWHLGKNTGGVDETVRVLSGMENEYVALPHPSWRNNTWLKRNPWFEAELVPKLRIKIKRLIS